MATSAARVPPTRRASTSSHMTPTATSIARGATARSAVSPKVSAAINGNRRSRVASLASAVEADVAANTALTEALKRETEEKEELLVRVQNKEQNIAELASENAQLSAVLNAAETRIAELYADQARIEEDTAARLELVDRLRAQVQELEKEKREVLRRYNEQTATFDAERQSFYDNEQHLKSRIQSLVQTRKVAELHPKPSIQSLAEASIQEETEEALGADTYEETENVSKILDGQRLEADDPTEPPEMTSLRLELSTLSTSYSSLQTTVQHLSSQLLDLKRVNAQLQEENESYNILLRERTLNGQFDILKSASTKELDEGSTDDGDAEEEDDEYMKEDHSTLPSRSRTPLEPVDELAEDMDSGVYGDEQEQDTLVQDDSESFSSAGKRERSRRAGRGGRRNMATSRSPPSKGESLAGLPVAGPGLDLAAELGRAENSAMWDGNADVMESRDRSNSNAKPKRGKRQSTDRKADSGAPDKEYDALRNEVKALKDANKALSLYASKIIDRIIAQEGFEHVLAADYEKSPPAKKTAFDKPAVEQAPKKKARPQSAIFGLSLSSTELPTSQTSQGSVPPSSPIIPTEKTATAKAQRRSLSFDWRPSFSMFGGSSDKKPEANANLRPLSLRPGARSVVAARKLDTEEDDEDRKERERLHATMKLMGINKPMAPTLTSPNIGSPNTFLSSPSTTPSGTPDPRSDPVSPKTATLSRFSFFRSRSNTSENSVNSSNSAPGGSAPESNLTAEALERAEAETTIAALDEREKVLSAEIAKGSNGGFTELPARRQRGEGRSKRSRKSGGSGSGSTVWSAGMSTHIEEDSADEARRA